MEILGIIAIIVVFGFIRAGLGAVGNLATGKTASGDIPFKVRATKSTETFEGSQYEVIKVEMKGGITAPFQGYAATLSLTAMDVTGGKKEPIVCTLDALQLGDTPVLAFISDFPLPYQANVLQNWIDVVSIPIDTLVFPRKGMRTVKFLVDIKGTNASSTCTTTYDFKDAGYMEARENREKLEVYTVQLAFAVSSADGEVHQDEAHIIREWIRKRVEMSSDAEAAKDRLNNTIKQELESFKCGKLRDVKDVCKLMLDVASVADRYDALELCLKVAQADGVAEEDELRMVNQLADLLGVDQDRFRAMRDKHFAAVIQNQSGVLNVDELLGITSDMSEREIKKHLRQEFQKWNQLAAHKDAAKREQAKEMLDLIGQKRAELSQRELANA
ncbi:TerB family tellurite resistance protein [Pontiella sulfatireligans]|uniref:Co-chaperone DjlA N-terminal domain-containing protein n=1 Tax=Pontiella sulfatireligans TaxID=2750658 RepID=A0A6C2US49_9BACT|nr:TerB family tellurite resistance protein [Pontiella sulfatireligans]VGO23135.1 hypothetical protein SCARR_05240 [Pontiella sulfatireligans]